LIGAGDPHPFAAGVGVERLRAAGVIVDVGLMADEVRVQNSNFFAQWNWHDAP
jgi:diaminohydroxyphosphoribosylaminopyrimidine deaminase/5-amino-6-(5-phosphoribosylamino)uracil reductase